jgi:hypothetical protein
MDMKENIRAEHSALFMKPSDIKIQFYREMALFFYTE